MIKKIILSTIVIVLICFHSFSQNKYHYFREFADNKPNNDSVIMYFNDWFMFEKNMDSLQVIFIDYKLKRFRQSKDFIIAEDSLKQEYRRQNPSAKNYLLGYELWCIGAMDQASRSLGKYYKPEISMPKRGEENYNEKMHDFIQKSNAEQIKRQNLVFNEIEKYNKWLGYSLVGKYGSKAAFLVIQHGDKKTIKRGFKYLKKAVLIGDANPYHYAMMFDRLKIKKNRKQKYGTQYSVIIDENNNRHKVLKPLKNSEKVNVFRKKMGMMEIEKDSIYKWDINYNSSLLN